MSILSSAYITDVTYPDYFHRELMPLWLCSGLQAMGRRTPALDAPFTWLELGCGTGMSTLIAAATHQYGQFIGIDINAQAIAQAQALANAAGIRNVQFLCADFEQLCQSDQHVLPACDFIVSHGVYSWISPNHRFAMRQIIERQLKPGGICYLAYMSQPGSSALCAAQKLAQLHAQRTAGNCSTRVQHALSLLQRTAASGTGYFAENAGLAPELAKLSHMSTSYVAHEFLNSHWDCLHVADVISEMQAIDCEWVGSATLLENIDAASLPQSVLPLLHDLRQQGASAQELETFKDIARNQNQRRDLFQRTHHESNTLSAEQHRQQLLQQRITLLPAAPAPHQTLGASLRLPTRIGPVDMPMAHIQPLLQMLQQNGPSSYADLLQIPLYARQPAFVNQLLQTLCWAGWIQFVHPVSPDAAQRATAQRLNQLLASHPCGHDAQVHWACPSAGSAIPATEAMTASGIQQRLHWLGLTAAKAA